MSTPPRSSPSMATVVREQVSRTVNRLANTRNTSAGNATLAHLRANIGREPGVDPSIWGITIDGLPGALDHDEPTEAERAVHGALTLYALHQRATSDPMHRAGDGLGRAVRRLEEARGGKAADTSVSPVRRRFDAVVVSQDLRTLLSRLRPLVDQMRGARVPLDYSQLAVDLFRWQYGTSADGVRRRWSRDYYRFNPTTDTSEAIDGSAPTEEAS